MPAVGQGEGKLCPRTATACDPALRSGHFRLKVSLLSGNHKRNITLASKMSCSTANFAKGSRHFQFGRLFYDCLLEQVAPLFLHALIFNIVNQ